MLFRIGASIYGVIAVNSRSISTVKVLGLGLGVWGKGSGVEGGSAK